MTNGLKAAIATTNLLMVVMGGGHEGHGFSLPSSDRPSIRYFCFILLGS
jgi:hypothetical protein